MRIPPYWTRGEYTGVNPKGKEMTFTAWGWSFESISDARKDAIERANRIFNHFGLGAGPLQRYPYFEHPIREEIVEALQDGNKDIAITTRNAYGALVLNAASVMFVDVDYPEDKSGGLGGMVGRLFGGGKKKQEPDGPTQTLQRVKDWAAGNRDKSFRIYGTQAGLRLLFTDKLYDPEDNGTTAIMNQLGCDPVYIQLTTRQKCFRARLTPKPWRCKFRAPRGQFPFEKPGEEQEFRQWEQQYNSKIQGYATCELLEVIGSGSGNGEVQQIVSYHDRHVLKPNAPLA